MRNLAMKASAAAGEDILSGAYAKREADSSREIEELRGHLEDAKAKVRNSWGLAARWLMVRHKSWSM